MKLLFANEYFVPHAPGGAEWSLFHWVRLLAQRGHTIVVVTPDLSEGRQGETFEEDRALQEAGDVRLVRFPFSRSLARPPRVFSSYVFGNPFFARFFAGHIAREAAAFDAQLLVAHGYDSLVPVAHACARLGSPGVATVRDYRALCPVSICLHRQSFAPIRCSQLDFIRCLGDYHADYDFRPGPIRLAAAHVRRQLEWSNSLRVKKALAGMNGAVFVSQGIREIYSQATIAPAVSEVVYNVTPAASAQVDPADVRDRFDLGQKKILLYVGRFSIGKGAESLTQAVPKVLREYPDAVVVVAGNREYQTEVEGMHFVGHVDRRTLNALYAASHAVVLPSRWPEPFSRVLLEASRHRLPVIATPVGGNPEAVVDDRNGFVVLRNDPDALADACLRMLRMPPEHYARMKDRSALLVRETITPESQVQKLETFYEKIIGEGSS